MADGTKVRPQRSEKEAPKATLATGKKRAASPLTPTKVRDKVRRQLRHCKRESSAAPLVTASRIPPRSLPPTTPQLDRPSEQRDGRNNEEDGGAEEQEAFADDARVRVLIEKPLGGKAVEAAAAGLVRDSFAKGGTTLGLAFLDRVSEYVQDHVEPGERHRQIDGLLRQQWRRQLAIALAGSVTSDDEAVEVATAFGERLVIKSPHHGFVGQVKLPTVGEHLEYLARQDLEADANAPDEDATIALRKRHWKRARTAFCQSVEQLRLLCMSGKPDESFPQKAKDAFGELRMEQQRKWLEVCESQRRHGSSGSQGSRPWRLMLDHGVPALLGLGIETLPMTPSAGSAVAKPFVSGKAAHPNTPSLPGKTPSEANNHDEETPSGKLKRPGHNQARQLREGECATPILVSHPYRKCVSDSSVLFTVAIPGRPETNISLDEFSKACRLHFWQGLHIDRIQELEKHIFAVTFRESRSAKRAADTILSVDKTKLVAERAHPHAPTVFSADWSVKDATTDEAEGEIRNALRQWESLFTLAWVPSRIEPGAPSSVLVQFRKTPGLQCFFIPLSTHHEAAQKHRHWIWFKPMATKEDTSPR